MKNKMIKLLALAAVGSTCLLCGWLIPRSVTIAIDLPPGVDTGNFPGGIGTNTIQETQVQIRWKNGQWMLCADGYSWGKSVTSADNITVKDFDWLWKHRHDN